MSRSRSSFDLGGAIATAASLATPGQDPTLPRPFAGVDLVSFHRGTEVTREEPRPEEEQQPARPARAVPTTTRTLPPDPIRGTPPPPAPLPNAPASPAATSSETTQAADAAHVASLAAGRAGPPKLPDLSAVVSPILRCEMIVDWIAEATGASGVFLADSAGMPLAGAIYEAEAILAGSGAVATSVLGLASAVPGSASPLFEMHVGEGPVFQLVGFQAGTATYVVGFVRATPLSPRQAHAIRLACKHALGPTLEARA